MKVKSCVKCGWVLKETFLLKPALPMKCNIWLIMSSKRNSSVGKKCNPKHFLSFWGGYMAVWDSISNKLQVHETIINICDGYGCDGSVLKYVCIQMHTRNTFLHLLIRDSCLVMPEMNSIHTVSLNGIQWVRTRQRDKDECRQKASKER